MSGDTESRGRTLLLVLLLLLILLALLLLLLKTPAEAGKRRWPPPTAFGSAETSETPAFETGGAARAERVATALLGRPDLIPYEGTLGGSMGFYSRENIEVLNDRWVFARFEDGHRMGSMLLEYRWTPEGEVVFSVIEATLP